MCRNAAIKTFAICLFAAAAICCAGRASWIAAANDDQKQAQNSREADEHEVAARRSDQLKPMPDSVRATIKLDRKEYLLGESIAVEFEMTNTGEHPVRYETGGFFPDLRLASAFRMVATPLGEDGNPFGPAILTLTMPDSFDGPVGGATLKPGNSHSTVLFVTRYLRFSNPGQYVLRIEKVDAGSRVVSAKGETTITLKQPTLEEARDIYRRMKLAPRQAWDDNKMTFLKAAADFSTMHQTVYLPVLEEALAQGDIDAIESLSRREQMDANEILIAAIDRALDNDQDALARACYQGMNRSLPFPNWFYDWTTDFDQKDRQRVIQTWKPGFTPVLIRLARRMTAEVVERSRLSGHAGGAKSGSQPTEQADGTAGKIRKVQDDLQASLVEIDYIYYCLGRNTDLADCLKAYAVSIELTKTLPLETHQYFRSRGSAYGFRFSVLRMFKQGAAPPARPADVGEAAAFALALQARSGFRPEGWQQEVMKWLQSDSPYLAEMFLEMLPEPAPEEVLEFLPTALANDYIDLKIAACHLAERHPRPAYQEPLRKILATAKEPYLRKFAVDAARANGLEAEYDPHAPFVN